MGDVGRRLAVGRFAPALRTADHAASNHRQIRLRVEPVTAGLVKGQFKAVGAFAPVDGSWGLGQLHDPGRQRTLLQHHTVRREFVST